MFKKVIFVLTLLCFQSLIASDIITIDESVLPEFSKDGQVKVKGKILKDGKYRANNREEGNSYMVFSVKNGLLNGPYVSYYGNGIKEAEGFFKNGGLEGIKTIYYDDGNKYLTVSYHNDIPEGPFTQYYPSGEKRAEGFHKSGKLDGLLITYANFSRDQKKKYPQLGKYKFKAMEMIYRDGKIQGKGTKFYNFYPSGVSMHEFSELKDSAEVVYGKGEKEYILFMDPECAYCKKFEQLFPGLYSDVTFYIYDKSTDNATLRETLDVRETPTVFDISGEQVSWESFKALSEKNKKRGLIPPKYTIIKGLMWQDEFYTSKERELYRSTIGAFSSGYGKVPSSHRDAVDYCEDLNYGGYSDWTLPSKNQLLTLYKNKSKLNNNMPYNFWSKNKVDNHNPKNYLEDSYWFVDFLSGKQSNTMVYTTTSRSVRCVREVQ